MTKIFLASILTRLVVLGIAFLCIPFTVQDLMEHSDAPAYIAIAEYLNGAEVTPSDWDKRVFPGWSYFLALFVGLDLRYVAVVFSILFAGLAGSLFHLVVKDEKSAWWFIALSPALIFQSVLGMSEAFFLSLQLAGLHCHLNSKHKLSGLLLGIAGVVRPTALFIFLPVLLENLKTRDKKAICMFLLCAAACPIGMLAINQLVFGDLFLQLHQYQGLPNLGNSQREALGLAAGEGSHFGLPFKNLILTSALASTPLWKQFYIWGHVLLLAISLWFAFSPRNSGKLDFIFRWWALGNAVFVLSTGEYWAFHSFDRYFIWALPAYVYFLTPLLNYTRLPTSLMVMISTACALFGMLKFLV